MGKYTLRNTDTPSVFPLYFQWNNPIDFPRLASRARFPSNPFIIPIKGPGKLSRRASRAGFYQYFLCIFNKRTMISFPGALRAPDCISIPCVFPIKGSRKLSRRASRAEFSQYFLCISNGNTLKFPGALRAPDFISISFICSLTIPQSPYTGCFEMTFLINQI